MGIGLEIMIGSLDDGSTLAFAGKWADLHRGPKEEADRLIKVLSDIYDNLPGWREEVGLAPEQSMAWYDTELDAYATASENEPGETDWWNSMEISIDGEAITVYKIGTWHWTWVSSSVDQQL
jgi:hypothetical protein